MGLNIYQQDLIDRLHAFGIVESYCICIDEPKYDENLHEREWNLGRCTIMNIPNNRAIWVRSKGKEWHEDISERQLYHLLSFEETCIWEIVDPSLFPLHFLDPDNKPWTIDVKLL